MIALIGRAKGKNAVTEKKVKSWKEHFIQQTFVEHGLFARYFSRSENTEANKINKNVSCPKAVILLLVGREQNSKYNKQVN